MHMADALLSPPVAGVMLAATAGTAAWCIKRVREDMDERIVPLMGVAGALVFSAQMLNFTIPGTGSSGHLGGGLLLAALLGPHAAFLVMVSILVIQGLFFADGGLLALGANIFNLGFFPAFIGYALIYRRIVGDDPTVRRLFIGGVLGAVVGLQLGAFGVVAQTALSGVTELPFTAFLAMMLPIHLPIGIIEGIVTAGILAFILKAQPELIASGARRAGIEPPRTRRVAVGLLTAAVLGASMVAWFASASPDGLDWSMERVAGTAEIRGASTPLHEATGEVQERLAFLPGYGFRPSPDAPAEAVGAAQWPAVSEETSVAGAAGVAMTLGVLLAMGLLFKWRASRRGR